MHVSLRLGQGIVGQSDFMDRAEDRALGDTSSEGGGIGSELF